MLSRHRDLARQKHKMAGVESAFARLESARALDMLILSLQDKVAQSPSSRPHPLGVKLAHGSSSRGTASDLGREALFVGGDTHTHARTHTWGESVEADAGAIRTRAPSSISTASAWGGVAGLEVVSNLIDDMVGGRGSLDFEALMALSQSVGSHSLGA